MGWGFPDADGVRSAGQNTQVADVDIVIAGGKVETSWSRPMRRCRCRLCAVPECARTIGRVVVSGGILQERLNTGGRALLLPVVSLASA